MIERNIVRPLRPRRDSEAPRSGLWAAVGRQLQRRRTELGHSTESVAQWAGVPAGTYEDYEKGAPIPASTLAQIADLFERPVVWFFEGIASEEPPAVDTDADREPAVYRVATIEHRVQALAESFRKLDFEGQQHLLAISQALTRSNASAARD